MHPSLHTGGFAAASPRIQNGANHEQSLSRHHPSSRRIESQQNWEVYAKYKQPFLETIQGATSKALLVREDDVQVLHGFKTTTSAEKYLQSPLFNNDVVSELKPFLIADPDIRIYEAMST